MKIGLLELCLAALLVTLLLLPFVLKEDSQNTTNNFVLNEGNYSWDVFVGGTRTTWELAYKNYNELPIKNSDYGDVVVYQGKKYSLWRVYSNQIQVSKEIID